MKKVKKISKKIKQEFVKKQLETDQKWALAALLRIYERQTPTEQEYENTSVYNQIGFTGVDGEILTSIGKQYKRKGYVSPKQLKIVMKKMKKYWKQILEISDDTKLIKIMLDKGIITKDQAFLYFI